MMWRARVWTLALGMLLAVACAQQATPSPSPSPTPTPTATPQPTHAPTAVPATPTATPEPTPSPTKTPTPVPTVTTETAGFEMEDLTPEEQALAFELETSYRTATENQGLKEGIIYLTHGDQVGEVGAYFQDKTRKYWYLVGRGEQKILEEAPKLQGTTIIWNPNETRFVYQPQGVPFNWIWKPPERMVYDPVNNINVAQWNPETSSWKMNPEPPPTPEPENWTYIEGVEHVKFAEFNQEQLQMLKEAAVLVKQYDPERFALFEREIDWVVFCGTDTNRGGRYKIWLSSYNFEPMLRVHPRELVIVFLADITWGHEFQHSIQAMEGRDFNKICPNTGREVCENEASKAQVNLLRKVSQGISEENQSTVDDFITQLESYIDPSCTW